MPNQPRLLGLLVPGANGDAGRVALEGYPGLLARELIGRRAREFVSRDFTTGVASRYIELLNTNDRLRERVGAANGGTVP